MQIRRVKDSQAEVSTLDSTHNPKSTFKPNLEPSDQNAQRPQTPNTQKEISIDMEKHKDCQLESATMDSSSSLQGATGTAKTDPSNAYQQQNTKGTFHKRSGLQSTNTQQGNYAETLLKQTVVDRPLLEDTNHKKNAKTTQKRNTTKSQQNRKNDGDQIIYISSLEQHIQNQNTTIELLKENMEIIQNQKHFNQCKDNQNTSNSGTFNMEQLRKETESHIKQEMQNQMMDMRLGQVENQMMQFMCLNTTITTQVMVQSQNSCNHMINIPNTEDNPIGNLQQMWNTQQNLNQQHQLNQQIRTQSQSNHQYHQPESSQRHPNEPAYVNNQHRWQNQREDEDQSIRQSNVNSQYQGQNQREDEDQTMSQGKVRSQYRWQIQRDDEDQTIRQSNVRSQYHNHCYS
jgi:hypothetical protein